MFGNIDIVVIATIVALVLIWAVIHKRRRQKVVPRPQPVPISDYRVTDVMNISGDLIPELDDETHALLDRGKNERVMILQGTEGGRTREPYAVTRIRIQFDNEHDLRNCVRMLRWSDERLRARLDQMLLWDWDRSFRDHMAIEFGVTWYDRAFFEKRKNAFSESRHASYYAMFGATTDRFDIHHEVVGA